MKVIVEAGGTKIQWAILTDSNIFEFETSGFNPNLADRNYLRQLLVSSFPSQFNANEVSSVYYYGTGCSNQNNIEEVKRALINFFISCKELRITSDLEAAGKAVFKDSDGLIGILGTGSSFAYYKNGVIAEQAVSLGFLLGDEGSGADIGKVFLKRLLHNELPQDIINAYLKSYDTNTEELLSKLNKTKTPNKYLAEFLPFIKNNIHQQSLLAIVEDSISTYVNMYAIPFLSAYPNKKVGLIGGVAFNFKDQINEIFNQKGLSEPTIVERPFIELIRLEKE